MTYVHIRKLVFVYVHIRTVRFTDATALATATDFDGFTPARADDLYTAWAANRQPAPAGYGGVAHRKLAGVDDLYTARAANRHPAPAGYGGASAQEARWRGRPRHGTGC